MGTEGGRTGGGAAGVPQHPDAGGQLLCGGGPCAPVGHHHAGRPGGGRDPLPERGDKGERHGRPDPHSGKDQNGEAIGNKNGRREKKRLSQHEDGSTCKVGMTGCQYFFMSGQPLFYMDSEPDQFLNTSPSLAALTSTTMGLLRSTSCASNFLERSLSR